MTDAAIKHEKLARAFVLWGLLGQSSFDWIASAREHIDDESYSIFTGNFEADGNTLSEVDISAQEFLDGVEELCPGVLEFYDRTKK